ncbi:MAG: LamG domain-containing protein [Planctomycetota bacterium]
MKPIYVAYALCVLYSAVCPPPSASAADDLAGSWSFEEPGDAIKDLSGKGLNGAAAGCARAPGHAGQALKLDGKAGMTVPDSPLLHAGKGFAIECWVRLDSGPAGPPMNIITKANEYMLRVDPESAGGCISFFVRTADGAWDPRARGPRPVPGTWYHIIATWDQRTGRLWVNGKLAASAKPGTCAPGAAPLAVGGPVEGLAGLVGLIDEVRFYRHAFGPVGLARRTWAGDKPEPAQKRTDAAFEFNATAEGWDGEDGVEVALREGALWVTLHTSESLLKVVGLDIDTAVQPITTVRMAALSGTRGVCVFVSDKMVKEIPFRIIADGQMHSYTLRCTHQDTLIGRLWGMGLRLEGAQDSQVRIDFIRLDKTSHAPPDLRILSLAPERRINGLGGPAQVKAWIRNVGGEAKGVSARLTVPPDVTVVGDPTQAIGGMDFDWQLELTWTVRSDKPAGGDIRLELMQGGAVQCAMTRPVQFAADPDEAGRELARSRPWLRAGYPRCMDFRHLFPQSVMFLEHNTVFLVDFIGYKIQAAQEFKRRYPDRLILMQVNDEVNGIWGSWHVVPREFAVKENLKCDPAIFPMPAFRGYWLLGPGEALSEGFPASAETCGVAVDETKWFILTRFGRDYLRDVLVYRRVEGRPDWSHSEYATVTKVDKEKKTITIQRWPKAAVGEWRDFRKNETYLAPSVGDIYRLYEGPVIKTWVPNLTKFCPRDPATGMDAVTWWAKHFANLWRTRIANVEPHPDGIQFDGLDEGRIGDCDNDGVVDACEIGGINYWKLGLYDFFRALREGGDGWKGMGEDLILADCSNPFGPACVRLLNGSENEEFPSFQGPQFLPTGMDLYRVWCAEAARPPASYIQGRFACDTYIEHDYQALVERDKFHGDSLVRFSIAAACMGEGIYTYRAGSQRDIRGTQSFQGFLEYPWDEYHAGVEGTYNWLGLPLAEAVRLTDHLGPDLISADEPKGWELAGATTGVETSGPEMASIEGRRMVEVNVLSMDAPDPQQAGRRDAAERAVLLSLATTQPLDPGKEYSVEFWIGANPQYDEKEGERFKDVWRCVGVGLRAADRRGTEQWILVGPQTRHVALTLRAPAAEKCRVAFRVGGELGPVRVGGLRVREGCAEVFARRFEHGLVLANGSAVSPYVFDIAKLGEGQNYRRFRGAQAPDVNNGQPVGQSVTVPAQDGLLLMAE